MNKICTYVLVVFLSLFMTGCYGQFKPEADLLNQMKEPVKLKVLGRVRYDVLKLAFKRYEKSNPLVQIQYDCISSDRYYDVLRTKLVSGLGPDLFHMEEAFMGALYQSGYFEDITDEPYVKKLLDGTKYEVNGRTYGVSLGTELWGMLYNRDYFVYAGIQDTPKTWPQFLEVCERLKSVNILPIGGGFGDRKSIDMYEKCLSINRYTQVSLLQQEEKLNKGEMFFSDSDGYKGQVLEKVKLLSERGYFSGSNVKLSKLAINEAFARGSFAMVLAGSSDLLSIFKVSPNLNVGVFALPSNETPEETVKMWRDNINMWCVNSKAKDLFKKEAKSFLAFLFTKEQSEQFTNETTCFSPLTEGRLPTNHFPYDPALTDFLSYYDGSISRGHTGTGESKAYIAACEKFERYLLDIVSGRSVSVQDALSECDRIFQNSR